jgi:S1-C subfamily serine protease
MQMNYGRVIICTRIYIYMANNLITAMENTVRLVSHFEIYDIFQPSEIESQGKSTGTGFFINNRGYILTCYHVITDSIKIYVNVPKFGKKNFKATLISTYPEMDIAVIQIINYQNTASLQFGQSDKIKMGKDTIALGYPLGDDTIKITKGVISGIKDHLLQTDTPINEGNSGGPLLDENYYVVGINSSKISRSNVEGVGYSIPIDIFMSVMNKMTQTKTGDNITVLHQPSFYCELQCLEEETMRLFCRKFIFDNKNKVIEGAMITSILRKSPLSLANIPLERFDILISFDIYQIDNYGDVSVDWSVGKVHITDLVKRYKIDEPIKITFFSVKHQKIIETTITFRNESLYQIKEVFYPDKIKYINLKGMIICELTLNHLSDIINEYYKMDISDQAHMYNYVLPQNREYSRIFISKILPSSDLINNKNVVNSEGMIIQRVNGERMITINQFIKICQSSSIIIDGKSFIHIEMLNRENITLCLD